MNILIADDQPLFAEGLAEALRHQEFGEPLQIEISKTATAALEKTQPDYPVEFDLVILELGLAETSGLCLLEKLQKQHTPVPVLVVSSSDRQEDMERAIKSGAMGYVTKGGKPDEIMYAIKQIISGEPYFPLPMLSNEEPSSHNLHAIDID